MAIFLSQLLAQSLVTNDINAASHNQLGNKQFYTVLVIRVIVRPRDAAGYFMGARTCCFGCSLVNVHGLLESYENLSGLVIFSIGALLLPVFQIFIYMGPGLFERKIPMNNVNSASLSLGVRALFMLGSFTKRLPSTDGLLVVVLKNTVMVALQIEMQTCIPLGVRARCARTGDLSSIACRGAVLVLHGCGPSLAI